MDTPGAPSRAPALSREVVLPAYRCLLEVGAPCYLRHFQRSLATLGACVRDAQGVQQITRKKEVVLPPTVLIRVLLMKPLEYFQGFVKTPGARQFLRKVKTRITTDIGCPFAQTLILPVQRQSISAPCHGDAGLICSTQGSQRLAERSIDVWS